MIPPDVRAVFFDAVGTLLHPEPPAPVAYAAVARRFGSRREEGDIAARFRAAFRREEAFDLANGLRTSEEREERRWRRIVAEVLDDVSDPDACFAELYEHFGLPENWRCEAGAVDALAELGRAGYVLGIASNYDSRLRRVVAGMPRLARVNHLVISAEVGWRKPAPEFFAALCTTAGLSPEAILFVGDDVVNDYEGARAAGLKAVLKSSGGALRDPRLWDITPPG